VARKTKLTPDVQQRIVDAIGQGATYELAAQYGGIAQSTFYDWMNKHPEFSEAVKSAEGKAAIKWLALIDKAARGTEDRPGQWQAAAWKLERRYPYVYGKQVQEITGKDGAPVSIELVEVVRPPKPSGE
jgi:transposase-like protein